MFKRLINNRFFVLLFIVLIIGISSCSKNEVEEPKDLPIRYLKGVYPDSTITDGPFISVLGSQYTVRWIVKNNAVVEKIIKGNDYGRFSADFGFPFESILSFQNELGSVNYFQEYTDVKHLVALSDIHGQYEIFVDLLKNNGVVDENLNWIFGEGHLVIDGDVFDRGNRVTENLWLIFKLENQAASAGGKLHYLLGNHEVMVLNNDLRYIDPKYNTNARRLGTTYDQLYSEATIIGQWLRTKPVVVKINDMIFNHAGISMEIVRQKLTPQDINRSFLEDIIDKDPDLIDADSLLDFLTGSEGPIWYRGYFEDDDLNLTKLNAILEHLNSSTIIVGHTSMEEIKFFFEGKVIGIDSSIKNGISGQVLIYNQGVFSIGTLDY